MYLQPWTKTQNLSLWQFSQLQINHNNLGKQMKQAQYISKKIRHLHDIFWCHASIHLRSGIHVWIEYVIEGAD